MNDIKNRLVFSVSFALLIMVIFFVYGWYFNNPTCSEANVFDGVIVDVDYEWFNEYKIKYNGGVISYPCPEELSFVGDSVVVEITKEKEEVLKPNHYKVFIFSKGTLREIK